MAEGIRIRHTVLKGPAIVAVRDITEHRDYAKLGLQPPPCSVCQLPSPGHEGYKTRHITIDSEGYAIVSEGVWEGLTHLIDHGGFVIENPVPSPPKISLDMNTGVTKLIHKYQPPILERQVQEIKNGQKSKAKKATLKEK